MLDDAINLKTLRGDQRDHTSGEFIKEISNYFN